MNSRCFTQQILPQLRHEILGKEKVLYLNRDSAHSSKESTM